VFGRIVLAAGSEYKEPAARLWPVRPAFLDRAVAKEKESVCVGVRVCGCVGGYVCVRGRENGTAEPIYTHTHTLWRIVRAHTRILLCKERIKPLRVHRRWWRAGTGIVFNPLP